LPVTGTPRNLLGRSNRRPESPRPLRLSGIPAPPRPDSHSQKAMCRQLTPPKQRGESAQTESSHRTNVSRYSAGLAASAACSFTSRATVVLLKPNSLAIRRMEAPPRRNAVRCAMVRLSSSVGGRPLTRPCALARCNPEKPITSTSRAITAIGIRGWGGSVHPDRS
jgi:hypothetical protein